MNEQASKLTFVFYSNNESSSREYEARMCYFSALTIGFFPSKVMQTFPPPFRSGHIYMKDAHSAKSNDKLVFRFLRFSFCESWLIGFTVYGVTSGFSSVSPTKIVHKWPNSQEIIIRNKMTRMRK